MPFVGWLLVGGGMFVFYALIKGESPLAVFKDVVQTGKNSQAPGSNSNGAVNVPEMGGGEGGGPGRDAGISFITGGSSGARQNILAVAQAQLGKPYQWGATGPDKFDCSGLTQYCYKNGAGITIPRVSGSQAHFGQATNQPQPGDIVWFGSPVHHVGIYVGGSQIIHAPEAGEPVEVATIWNETHGYRNIIDGNVLPGGTQI